MGDSVGHILARLHDGGCVAETSDDGEQRGTSSAWSNRPAAGRGVLTGNNVFPFSQFETWGFTPSAESPAAETSLNFATSGMLTNNKVERRGIVGRNEISAGSADKQAYPQSDSVGAELALIARSGLCMIA